MLKTSKREEEIIQKTTKLIVEYCNPKKIILFGSRAKQSNRKSSDFDFAVDCDPPTDKSMRELKESISTYSGLYSVDIVFLNKLDAEFIEIIKQTGKVIYEKGN